MTREFELEPGEHVIAQVRQHVFVLLLKLVPFGLLAIAPFIVAPIFAALVPAVEAAGISASSRFFVGMWLLFLWMAAFHIVTKYFLTVWVVTSRRIVDIEQHGFFRREVSSFLLARVQDVTTNVDGVFQTLVGFGDIHVETAGRSERFAMPGIPNPEHMRDLIMSEIAAIHSAGGGESPTAGV